MSDQRRRTGALRHCFYLACITPLTLLSLAYPRVATADTIATGLAHNCAITSALGLKCWGANDSGQLGNNSKSSSVAPVDVYGFSASASAISAGRAHACATTFSSAVVCWGDNSSDQLGSNTSVTKSSTPIPVFGLTEGVAVVSAGNVSTCAIKGTGGVVCWGDNSHGGLGNGGTSKSKTPVAVVGIPERVAGISVGDQFACAVTSVGHAYCWGRNEYGQLGNGTTTDSSTPTLVSGLSGNAVAIAVGRSHACALTVGGLVFCWGFNQSGQLGNGTSTSSTVAAPVSGLAGAVAIAAGEQFVCAVVAGGLVECWGDNKAGQLGNGMRGGFSNTPSIVKDLTTSSTPKNVLISAGQTHACALTLKGGVACWGANEEGQLGNGTTSNSAIPVLVHELDVGIVAIASGGLFSCAMSGSGILHCWGHGTEGELGSGASPPTSSVPVSVSGFSGGIAAVAAGNNFSCAITLLGDALCWGDNSHGQLGNGETTSSPIPVPVRGLKGRITAISAGANHACAVANTGVVLCWGENTSGQLGNGTTVDSPTPVPPLMNGTAIAVATGGAHTCVLLSSSQVSCWGANAHGQLGDGTNVPSPKPVAVMFPASATVAVRVVSIATGDNHSCALNASGLVMCWGLNASGQIGSGDYADSSRPLAVRNLIQAKQVAASSNSTCALTTSGAVFCWGDAHYGQLGNLDPVIPDSFPPVFDWDCFLEPTCRAWATTMQTSPLPVPATGLSSGVVGLSNSRGNRELVVRANGTLYAWGTSSYFAECCGGSFFYFWSLPSAVPEIAANTMGVQGVVRQKYRVLGVYYAPPGSKSSATYAQGFTSGTSTSFSQSTSETSTSKFSTSVGLSLKLGSDSIGVSGSQAASGSWSTQVGSSYSVGTSSTQSGQISIPGPNSSQLGVDHSEDVIWLWLNPSMSVSLFAPGPSPISVVSVNFDARDPVGDLDIIPLTVAQLQMIANGKFANLPYNVQVRLLRPWSSSGPIDSADGEAILSADPFVSNALYDPVADLARRFDPIGIPPVNYSPADGQHGQPIQQNYSAAYSTTSMAGQTAQHTYVSGVDSTFGVNETIGIGGGGGGEAGGNSGGSSSNGGGAANFGLSFGGIDAFGSSMTIADQWSSQTQDVVNQSAAFSISQPLSSDGYVGPTAITVWKDNIYGTFMFYPVKQSQEITFEPIPDQALKTKRVRINASSNSILGVTFASETPLTCSVTGIGKGVVAMFAPGNCIIAADQVGDVLYKPAQEVKRSFVIRPPPPALKRH
jgi:alpha-tubulin suppressor-like RCC1 family protein